MKIKDRLGLRFTLLVGVLLLILETSIYFFIGQFRAESFYDKLDERALTVAQFHLAKDNLTGQEFKEVLHKFPQSLSGESFRIYDRQLRPRFVAEDTLKWDRAFLTEILADRVVHRSIGKQQVAGIYYKDNSGDFLFVVSAVDKRGLAWMEDLGMAMVLIFFVFLVITFLLGRVFASLALRPVVKMTGDLRGIRADELHTRLSVSSDKTDEVDDLSIVINQLLEHLEQTFEQQKSFVAHASHELKTPLTAILGQAETTLLKERTVADHQLVLKGIIENVVHLDATISSLMELMGSTMEVRDFEQLRIDELAWELADEFKLRFGENSITVNYDLPDDGSLVYIYGNRGLLFLAVNNLLKNARKFSDDQPIRLDIVYQHDHIAIRVEDHGIGIPPEDISQIFRPFFRSTSAGRYPGSGIGLSLSHNIFRLHNTSVNVISRPGRTVFELTLATDKLK